MSANLHLPHLAGGRPPTPVSRGATFSHSARHLPCRAELGARQLGGSAISHSAYGRGGSAGARVGPSQPPRPASAGSTSLESIFTSGCILLGLPHVFCDYAKAVISKRPGCSVLTASKIQPTNFRRTAFACFTDAVA